jgi:hypothetical protein
MGGDGEFTSSALQLSLAEHKHVINQIHGYAHSRHAADYCIQCCLWQGTYWPVCWLKHGCRHKIELGQLVGVECRHHDEFDDYLLELTMRRSMS